MSYHYTDPSRESEEHALPNLEVFQDEAWMDEDSSQMHFVGACDCESHSSKHFTHLGQGFYYAFGFPGCLWDSDPVGPFDTEAAALAAAREAHNGSTNQ